MQAWTRSIGTVKAGVVLQCHKASVLNGYGWARQRLSADGVSGREWLQRWQMLGLRCHNFELTKPTS